MAKEMWISDQRKKGQSLVYRKRMPEEQTRQVTIAVRVIEELREKKFVRISVTKGKGAGGGFATTYRPRDDIQGFKEYTIALAEETADFWALNLNTTNYELYPDPETGWNMLPEVVQLYFRDIAQGDDLNDSDSGKNIECDGAVEKCENYESNQQRCPRFKSCCRAFVAVQATGNFFTLRKLKNEFHT